MPPVQHGVELSREPDAADGGAVVQLDARVDADVAPLALQRLRDALANREAGLGDQRERERLAVTLANGAGRGAAPPGCVEERPGAIRVERIGRHLVGVCADDTG